MALVNRNAARILEEKDLNSESLNNMINSLLSDKAELKQIEENARAMSVSDSRERIAEIIVSLAEHS